MNVSDQKPDGKIAQLKMVNALQAAVEASRDVVTTLQASGKSEAVSAAATVFSTITAIVGGMGGLDAKGIADGLREALNIYESGLKEGILKEGVYQRSLTPPDPPGKGVNWAG